MAKVECEVLEVELTNDKGANVASVCVTCSRCEAYQESYGTGPKSIRRCLALMRENCEDEDGPHFYVAEGSSDDD